MRGGNLTMGLRQSDDRPFDLVMDGRPIIKAVKREEAERMAEDMARKDIRRQDGTRIRLNDFNIAPCRDLVAREDKLYRDLKKGWFNG